MAATGEVTHNQLAQLGSARSYNQQQFQIQQQNYQINKILEELQQNKQQVSQIIDWISIMKQKEEK